MGEQRRNRLLAAAWIVTLLALCSNFLFFWQFAGESVVPWLGLVLYAVALVLCVMALRRAIRQPSIYRGRFSAPIVTVLACLTLAITIYAFYDARRIPGATEAPRVGEKAPEFTGIDFSGAGVSLSSLLNAPLANSPRPGGKPRAVLLVFYRGYW